MPKFLKVIFAIIAIAVLVSVIMIGAGGYWLSNNTDTMAEAAVEASGIKDAVAEKQRMQRDARCNDAKLAFQQMWDKAVDSNSVDQHQDMLYRAEQAMQTACSG